MSISLSIKDVPEEIAEAIRQRARENHRSLQGELMAMLERHARPQRGFRATELLEAARAAGLHFTDSSAQFIREERDRICGDA